MEEAGPSRDRKKGKGPERALAAPAPERRSSWVILPAIPVVISNEKKHLVPGTDMSLQFEEPPRTTILTVPERISDKLSSSRSQIPYVIDALPSGRLLFYATKGGPRTAGAYYIFDAHTRVATPLPPSLEQPIWPRRSVGFIEDPRNRGHHLVVQLHPTSTTQHKSLVQYSTESGNWEVKELASSPEHQVWGCHGGVIPYDGKLWWADLPYGFLTLDPFADPEELHLRHVALPHGCVMVGADTPTSREDIDKHRCAKVSEGKLRYVQIDGLDDDPVVNMWTLVDPERSAWQPEYEVRWAVIWGDDLYKKANLKEDNVPAIALIDPNNHAVVYFLQGGSGSMLFAVDMSASTNRVLQCEKYVMGHFYEDLQLYHTSRFVHAWELPQSLLGFVPPSLLRLETSSGHEMLTGMSKDLALMRNIVRMMKDVKVSAAGSESSSQPPAGASDQNEEK